MNTRVKEVLILQAGIVIGGLICWKALKAKYEKKYEEDVKESKERFKSYLMKDTEPIGIKKEEPKVEETRTISSIAPVTNVKKVNYNEKYAEKPHCHVIDPEDLNSLESDGYQCISYTHYSDDILVDETFDFVTNIEDIVGNNYKSHLGEYEEDSVCIRNDKYKLDIQIIFDPRKYSDVVKKMPTRLRPEE